jgi:hypothetical protein
MSKQPKVGDHLRVSLYGGKIVDAVIKAVIEHKDGLRFQVAFGHDQTVLIGEWQIVKDCIGCVRRSKSCSDMLPRLKPGASQATVAKCLSVCA